jgi:hypothetical protein
MMDISETEWKERFIARMIKHDPDCGEYAESVVDDYFNMREDYDESEEAAESDIEYWEL